jgi:hypothetical protein
VRRIDIDTFKVNSTQQTGDKPASPRLFKSGMFFMLLVLLSMALLAIFANVQRLRREKIETVIVKPANPR